MQPNEPVQPQLQDLAAAYKNQGPSALGNLRDRAVLIHCSAHAGKAATQFETVVAFAPWDAQVALAAARSSSEVDPEVLVRAGSVYAVDKRPGGPFPDRIGVGRARTADVSLRLASVSKYHAYFTEERDGEELTLWEARARNGTYVNGKRLDPGEGVALRSGAYIGFGEEEFLFFTASGFTDLLSNLAKSSKGG